MYFIVKGNVNPSKLLRILNTNGIFISLCNVSHENVIYMLGNCLGYLLRVILYFWQLYFSR